MSSRTALSSEASSARLLVLDGETPHEVFDLLGIAGPVIRVRSALLFEVGEELSLRIEQDGRAWDATARVRAHVGRGDLRTTELEISPQSAPDLVIEPAAESRPAGEPLGGPASVERTSALE